MATPAGESDGLPTYYEVRQLSPVEGERVLRGFEEYTRHREYFQSRRDDLHEKHPGKCVIVYGDNELLIGDDYFEMRHQIDDELLSTAFIWHLADVIQIPSVWLDERSAANFSLD